MPCISDFEFILTILWSNFVIKKRVFTKADKAIYLTNYFDKLLPNDMLLLKLLKEETYKES